MHTAVFAFAILLPASAFAKDPAPAEVYVCLSPNGVHCADMIADDDITIGEVFTSYLH